jgi:hypothetical protein
MTALAKRYNLQYLCLMLPTLLYKRTYSISKLFPFLQTKSSSVYSVHILYIMLLLWCEKSDCVFLSYPHLYVSPGFSLYPPPPPPPLIQHVAIGSFLLARCSVGRVRADMPSCTLSLLACSATPEVGVLYEP